MIENHLEYPEKLNDWHNEFVLATGKIHAEKCMLSNYGKKILHNIFNEKIKNLTFIKDYLLLAVLSTASNETKKNL